MTGHDQLPPADGLGQLHHLSLSVVDMKKSITFYKFLCEDLLQYTNLHISDQHSMWYKFGFGALGISPGNPTVEHNRYNPGLHHLAFAVTSRQEVDAFHDKIAAFYQKHEGDHKGSFGKILDPPAEYQYMPKYYAVFFTDPSGFKLELVHTPPEAYAASSKVEDHVAPKKD
ncbi:hypothetical protein DFQ27_000729 [Actinomortierella ambigua]|uniref:VOC domain-containing protein n=1 Tax=Actinomortierella ambigua TaxID=1343610 RepID=A0A9P6QJ79_9FUNG|nr:hypothetical protein DFQ27_000729 [Actinomortierella ambigua]